MNNNQENFNPAQNNIQGLNQVPPMPEVPNNINVMPSVNLQNTTTPTPAPIPNINTAEVIENQNLNIEQNNLNEINSMMQTVPTVNQDKQEFINNVQNENIQTEEKKESGPNYWFIIILATIILAAIIFLFPYLLKTL